MSRLELPNRQDSVRFVAIWHGSLVGVVVDMIELEVVNVAVVSGVVVIATVMKGPIEISELLREISIGTSIYFCIHFIIRFSSF